MIDVHQLGQIGRRDEHERIEGIEDKDEAERLRTHRHQVLLRMYELSGTSVLQNVATSQLADDLGLDQSDVTFAERSLLSQGIIRYLPGAAGPHCARLTRAGISQAEILLRSHFQALSQTRLREAAVLLADRHHEAAYYMAGCAVASAIKARVCRRRQEYQFPPRVEVLRDMHRRELADLFDLAGLEDALAADGRADPALLANVDVVKDWTGLRGYPPPSRADGERLYRAIADPDHGVLPWLQRYW